MISTWGTPGVVVTVYGPTDEALLLDNKGWSPNCTDGGFLTFANGTFTGFMRIWSNCDGTSTRVIDLVLEPADQSATVHVDLLLPDADDTPLMTVLASLRLA